MIGAVVLAAGGSSRFGADKRLHEVGGVPMVRRAVEVVVAAGLDPAIVVVGSDHDAVASVLEGTGAVLVVNEHASRGSRSSLRAGFAALPVSTIACVVHLADMPDVDASMVAAVADALRGGAPLVLSRYGAVSAPPTGFSRALFADLVGDGDDGGRSLVSRHRGLETVVDWPEERLVDLDRPEGAS